jgi:hypothetical protein
MADRVCEGCGASFVARSGAKFCGATCRKRGSRRVKPGDAAPVAVDLLASVEADLSAGRRLETFLGQQAVTLARSMSSGLHTGSALAALSKELRAVMDEALKGASAVADPVDEVRDRRDRKLRAVG